MSLCQLNLGLSEKMREVEEREKRARVELQDSKDQVLVMVWYCRVEVQEIRTRYPSWYAMVCCDRAT